MKRSAQKESLSHTNSGWLDYATIGAASTQGATKSGEAELHYSGKINVLFRLLRRRSKTSA
jgi:hypothetical protein